MGEEGILSTPRGQALSREGPARVGRRGKKRWEKGPPGDRWIREWRDGQGEDYEAAQ